MVTSLDINSPGALAICEETMYPAEVMSSDAGPRALNCAVIGPCRDQFHLDHLRRVVTESYVACRTSLTTCEVMNILCPLTDGFIDSVLIAMLLFWSNGRLIIDYCT